jgi:hypothetical protein
LTSSGLTSSGPSAAPNLAKALAMSLDERADDARDRPHAGGLAALEAKVRAQRLARCLERSRNAIDGGRLAEAREALNEAQTLAPNAPELDELERRIAAQPSPGAVFLSAEPRALERASVWPRVLTGMATIVVLIGLVGFGIVQLRHAGPVQELLSLSRSLGPEERAAPAGSPAALEQSPAASTPIEPAAPPVASIPDVPAAALAPPSGTDEVRPADEVHQAARAQEIKPTPAPPTASRPTRRLKPGPVDAPGDAPAGPTERVVPQPLSSGTPSGPPLAGGRPPAEAVALAMTNGSSTPTATTGGAGAASIAGANMPRSGASPEAPARSETKFDESLRIRAALLRYESAYNLLDAKAASSVWPGVDQPALDRAFSGLISQKVSLGLCDITVIGDVGGASCAGKARWEPKVGGGVQTADRHWDFQLRKSADGWKIQEIRVR